MMDDAVGEVSIRVTVGHSRSFVESRVIRLANELDRLDSGTQGVVDKRRWGWGSWWQRAAARKSNRLMLGWRWSRQSDSLHIGQQYFVLHGVRVEQVAQAANVVTG